MYVTDSIVIY